MESFANLVDALVRKLLLALIVVESAIVVVSVFARYVLNDSFTWSEEVARAILCWVVFLGATSSLKANEMVAMESLRDGMSDRKVLVTRVASELVVMVFLAAVTYATIELISLTHRQSFPVTGVPMWAVYIAIPISALIMMFHGLVRAVKLLRGTEPLRQEFVVDEVS